MANTNSNSIDDFTPQERNYIRSQLDRYFSTYPTVAEGFLLRSWAGGPRRGQPKVPLHAEGLLKRGLMRLDETARLPRLVFTEDGLALLRKMMRDNRQAPPSKFMHIREELGIE